MLQWTFLYIWEPYPYISISTGLKPKNVIVGLKGMCVKKQNTATKSLEYISSQNLTCITLDIINLKFLPALMVKNGNSLFCISKIVSDSENLFFNFNELSTNFCKSSTHTICFLGSLCCRSSLYSLNINKSFVTIINFSRYNLTVWFCLCFII